MQVILLSTAGSFFVTWHFKSDLAVDPFTVLPELDNILPEVRQSWHVLDQGFQGYLVAEIQTEKVHVEVLEDPGWDWDWLNMDNLEKEVEVISGEKRVRYRPFYLLPDSDQKALMDWKAKL